MHACSKFILVVAGALLAAFVWLSWAPAAVVEMLP